MSRRLLIGANLLAVLVVLGWAADQYLAPVVARTVYADQYQRLMFRCDQAMREHFIAKQFVLRATTEETIRNLDAAEIGLTACHHYDVLRKDLMTWGLTEPELARIGLDAIERNATDIRTFVEIHEIRY